jgi:alkylation response protein AidB-like acyl-CoA dehydrogenase
METKSPSSLLKGGEFLIKDADYNSIFMPEMFTEEQKMMSQTCEEFLKNEVWPNVERLDSMLEPELMPTLMDKAGELGLLGVSIPAEYGGMGLGVNAGTIVTESLGAGHSFSVAIAAHTGIGTLPILYFGTEAQKMKYLPKLASGEWKAAYALTETGSGSDALGAKTKATLSEDGKSWILNGSKMWITNSGFADVFVVFAKIDGEKFTGFIVEKGAPGFTLGAEEKKMGIKGSSTRQIFFENCPIPKENLLGEIGKGHLIAFNILNIGRYKLAAAALGGSKKCVDITVKYANERQQFQMPLTKFGAIRHKLAEQAIQVWALETATYRISNEIEQMEHHLLQQGKSQAEALLGAAQEYAAECAMLKVFGSEVLDYVVDESVQVHGGYGFSEEFPAARAYRDSRINRIFEGTNEINRMLTVDTILKRALKGELDLMTAAMNVQKELMSIPDFSASDEGEFSAEQKAISNMKKAILMVAGAAVQKLMQKLSTEQEILMNIADMSLQAFVCESLYMRVRKMYETYGEAKAAPYIEIMKVYFSDAIEKVNIEGKHALQSFADGDELRMMLMGLKRFTKYEIVNTKQLRRNIAKSMVESNTYCF